MKRLDIEQGAMPVSAKLFRRQRNCGRFTEKDRTSNIERPTSNVEWEKMKKQTYDNDILQEPEELTKIFVTSIKTAEIKQK